MTLTVFELINVGEVRFMLSALLVSNVPLLIVQVCGCNCLWTYIVSLLDCFINSMSPSDLESNRTLQIVMLLNDSGWVDLSRGIADVAVVIPLIFTPLQPYVDRIACVGLTTVVVATVCFFALIHLVLQEVIMFASFDK